MHPSSILDWLGGSIEHEYLALVPALVEFVHIAQIERGLAGERHPALVVLTDVRRVAVVPDVDGNLDALLLPLYHIRHSESIGEVEHTTQYGTLASIGRGSVRLAAVEGCRERNKCKQLELQGAMLMYARSYQSRVIHSVTGCFKTPN